MRSVGFEKDTNKNEYKYTMPNVADYHTLFWIFVCDT